MSNGRSLWLVLSLALSLGVYAAPPSPAAAAPKETKRYGLEGVLVGYEPDQYIFKIKVVNTSVSGGFGTGRVAGDPAPDTVKAGETINFAVVPEGSVLARTVIKGPNGQGLDNDGTKEGFAKAVNLIPHDRAVVISFQESGKSDPAPAWVIKMVQIRLSPAELEQRMREIGIDPKEVSDPPK